jgi:hypothetical protein
MKLFALLRGSIHLSGGTIIRKKAVREERHLCAVCEKARCVLVPWPALRGPRSSPLGSLHATHGFTAGGARCNERKEVRPVVGACIPEVSDGRSGRIACDRPRVLASCSFCSCGEAW